MLSIRQAQLKDILVIHHLAHQIWRDTYTNILSQAQIEFMLEDIYSEKALQQQMHGGIIFLLAEVENNAIAFASYSSPTSAVYKIHKLYIDKSQQGKGTGKHLINHIAQIALAGKAEFLELNVNRNNSAVDFYKKLGFIIYKSVDLPYYTFVLNDYIMRLSLSFSNFSENSK